MIRAISAADDANPRGKELTWAVAWVALLAAFVLFFNLGGHCTLETHEVYIGETAREMRLAGDWIVPHFGGVPRLTKPPLGYWIVAALSCVYGEIDAFLVRLPSSLSALCLVGLIGVVAGRWYGSRTGLCAALIQATSIYVFAHGRSGKADMLFALLTSANLLLGAAAFFEPGPRRKYWLWLGFYVLLGITTLCKGPLGPALVLGPLVLFLWLRNGWRGWRELFQPLGLAIFLALFLSWPCALLYHMPEAWAVWKKEFVDRAVTQTLDSQPIWYYLPGIVFLTLPYSPLVLLCARSSWIRAWKEKEPREQLVWVWLIAQVVLLSLSKGKRLHYALPALPALSLLAAQGLGALMLRLSQCSGAVRTWRGALVPGLAVGALCVGLGFCATFIRPQFTPAILWIAAAAASGVGFAMMLWLVGRKRAAAGAATLAFVCGYAILTGLIAPLADSQRAAVAFASRIDERLPAKRQLFIHGMGSDDQSPLTFYVKWPVERLLTSEKLSSLGPGPSYILTTRAHVDKLSKATRTCLVVDQIESRLTNRRTPPLVLLRVE